MTEKDLGKALLRGEGAIDSQAMTERILRRDRRRMWVLGIVCVFAWMMVVMLPWATILPMVKKVLVLQYREEFNDFSPPPRPTTISPTFTSPVSTLPAATASAPATETEQREQALLMRQVVAKGTIATFIGSIASMFVAAICTVSLIILSRRATLRQVNARLAEISAQLKTLGGGGGGVEGR